MNLGERRDVVIPLQQRGRGARAFDRTRVQFPNRVEHRMVVGVERVLLEPGVAGDVYLRHAVDVNTVHICQGIESMVLRGDVDVVHVEQNAAVGGSTTSFRNSHSVIWDS